MKEVEVEFSVLSEIIGCGIVVLFSVCGYFVTEKLVPLFVPFLRKAGLVGRDRNKKYKKKSNDDKDILIPESAGIVPAVVFLVLAIIFQLVFPDARVQYNAAMTSICIMSFLGFADDVLELPWRVKLLLPAVATIPLLVSYEGVTDVIIPLTSPPRVVHLGFVYYIYMLLLAVFCTNSINILAGINGLEVGQSIVISSAILVHNVIELFFKNDGFVTRNHHLFSLSLTLPFMFSSFALLKFNIFPATVFVGDTYTFFAGMTLAVIGILGHFSKTLLLFFIPQIFNFVYSFPQLIGFIPCPRHRLPILDHRTGVLSYDKKSWNLINFVLRLFGPMNEKSLSLCLIGIQLFCCCLALIIRHTIGR